MLQKEQDSLLWRVVLQGFMIRWFLVFMLLLAIPLVDLPLLAEDKGAAIWVEAEGTAIMGESITLQAAQRASLEEARRAAIEKAVGTYVTSSTSVRNFQLAEDLVRVISRGKILEEHVLERGVKLEGKGELASYRTRIKAKVQRVDGHHQGNFAVQSRLNHSVFENGDEAEIHITTSQDAYLYVFNVTEDDHVTILVPNRFLQDSFTKAGSEFTFPPDSLTKRGIKLNTWLMPGKQRSTEKIKVIASRHPVASLKHQAPDAMFKHFNPNETGMLTDLLKTLSTLDPGDWAETTSGYEVVMPSAPRP
jgi:hypothetical protein